MLYLPVVLFQSPDCIAGIIPDEAKRLKFEKHKIPSIRESYQPAMRFTFEVFLYSHQQHKKWIFGNPGIKKEVETDLFLLITPHKNIGNSN